MTAPSLPAICLLTDFGLDDVYVGVMKAVILGIAGPSVPLVDLTHRIPPQDVRAAVVRLAAAVPYFPPGTVHLAVVDPGVGSTRRPIVVASGGQLFVGPDNGLFTPFLQESGARAWLLADPGYRLPRVSRTFHGRDIFAPAAAWLARGVPPERFGPEVLEPTVLRVADVRREGDALHGRVVLVDVFGNLITDIAEEHVRGLGVDWRGVRVTCGPRQVRGLVASYADVADGDLLALFGSTGHVEIALNGGSAAAELGVAVGARVVVERSPAGGD